QVHCRGCSRELIRDHYRRNVGYYIAKARARNAITRQAFHERILAYLAEHPCVDCGQTDPVVLDFDHVDRATKSSDVGKMMKECWSWTAIEAEIEKCEVRCANCHRRRTAAQFGWYRLLEVQLPEEEARPDGLEPPAVSSED